ncbi:hypothetical protein [Streptomyces sp. V1I6]|uniref:hypothetical protein n=1 Tax=Streptomyces sp. V1I6 TaxID=3042273 RepID=UPI002787092C|nr:hypothetical protein [Streptomyces sp. V1I6]MDQ0848041.1 hypothetical protein [Streptomyces sp. V1I6]
MERIGASDFRGTSQKYVAQLNISTQTLEARWGIHEVSHDDLGEWLTFAFRMGDGTAVALVREVAHAPCDGYILTAISELEAQPLLHAFLAEAEIDSTVVTHVSSE